MTREKKDKILKLIEEEHNSYVEYINDEIAKLYGRIEGADYILGCLCNYLYNDNEKGKE